MTIWTTFQVQIESTFSDRGLTLKPRNLMPKKLIAQKQFMLIQPKDSIFFFFIKNKKQTRGYHTLRYLSLRLP